MQNQSFITLRKTEFVTEVYTKEVLMRHADGEPVYLYVLVGVERRSQQ